jgi:WD40 repeat protein
LWNAPKCRHFLTLKAHLGEVLSVAFSASGKRLASVNGAVTVWDAPSWKNSLTFTQWPARPLSVAFSPDAKWLASAGGHLALIWDLGRGTTLRSPDTKFGADSAATAPADKNRSASVSLDRPAIEESNRYKAVEFTWPGGGITNLEFSPDGKRIAGCGFSNATVWDIGLRKQVHKFELGFGYVRGVTFSRDGKRIAATGNDSTIRVWDAATGKLILSFKTAGAVANTSVAFSPDGTRLATGTFRNFKSLPNVMVWDARTGKACLALTGHEVSDVWKVAYSHDGKRLTSAGSDGVRVWDTQTGQQIHNFAGPGHRPVFSVACSPNDQRIVYGEDGTVKLKVLSGESAGRRSFQGHSGVIRDVAFSPNGKQVVSAAEDTKVILWDIGSDRQVLTYRGHGFPVMCVAFSPDGEWIASADQNRVVRIWSARPDQRDRVASERPSKQ